MEYHGSRRLPLPTPAPSRTPPRLPSGFRWIAVRPGAAPPARRADGGRLGPTPRYAVIPRWGLPITSTRLRLPPEQSTRTGPSAAPVRTTLFVSVLVLGSAALVYVLRYVLLVFNRNTLLNSLWPAPRNGSGWLASVVAIAAA